MSSTSDIEWTDATQEPGKGTPMKDQGVCEVFRGDGVNPMQRICEKPATMRYPAMGGGYMHLCAEHGAKHANYCETWDGTTWIKKAESPR